MKTYLKDAFEAIKSLSMRVSGRIVATVRLARPPKQRVIEIEYRRRSDTGTRRSAAIHIDARGRRQRS